MAALNLTNLKVNDSAEMPASRRGRPAEENPFHEVIIDSYNNEQAKQVSVPLAGNVNKNGVDLNVVKVQGLIRAAANNAEVGVSIAVDEPTKTTQVVRFLAKDKRAYTPSDTGETPVEDADGAA